MESFFETALRQGGLAIAFVVAMWALRESYAQRIQEQKDRINEERGRTDLIVKVLQEVSASISHLADAVIAQRDKTSEGNAMIKDAVNNLSGQVGSLDKDFAAHRGATEQMAASETGKAKGARG